MSDRIILEPMQETMRVFISVPALPDQFSFSFVVPETTGYVDKVALNFPGQKPIWAKDDKDGSVSYTLENENVVYNVRLVPSADDVTVIESLKNKTDEKWEHAFTFPCFGTERVRRFSDTEFDRTFLMLADGLTPIKEIERTASKRPLLQFYYMEGKRYPEHSFMDNFKATSPVAAKGSYVLTVSKDGKAVVGTATRDAAFLFNNGEFSCIHACPDFGTIYPGETRTAVTKLYFLQGGAKEFQERYQKDFRSKVSLLPSPRKTDPPARQAVDIIPPWDTEGHLTIRVPETLQSNLGLFFIDHYRADMLPVVDLEKLPDWQLDPQTGALSYNCKLPNNVEFSGYLVPGDDVVDMKFTVKNGTDTKLERLRAQFCVVQSPCPTFNIPELTHTYIMNEGKWLALADTTFKKMVPDKPPWIICGLKDRPLPEPGTSHPNAWYVCHERADVPLVATLSKDGKHVLALSWHGGGGIMSNGWIPCIHNDPAIPDCPPGESISVEGKLYLLTGDLDDLKARYEQDFK